QSAPFLLQHLLDPLDLLFPHRDHDVGNERRCGELAHRMHQYRRAFQQHELLPAGSRCFGSHGRHAALHTCAEPGCREDDGGFHDPLFPPRTTEPAPCASFPPRTTEPAMPRAPFRPDSTINSLPPYVLGAEDCPAVPNSQPEPWPQPVPHWRRLPPPFACARRICRKSFCPLSFAARS